MAIEFRFKFHINARGKHVGLPLQIFLYFPMPLACHQMIVHQPGGLHEGIADRGADKTETAFFEIRAHGIRFLGSGWYLLQRSPLVDSGFSPNKLPDIFIETAVLLLNCQEGFSVGNGGRNFETVADNARIIHQTFEFAFIESGDLNRVELGEGFAEVFPFVEDSRPGEARLKAIENDELEKLLVVMERSAPLAIVIGYG